MANIHPELHQTEIGESSVPMPPMKAVPPITEKPDASWFDQPVIATESVIACPGKIANELGVSTLKPKTHDEGGKISERWCEYDMKNEFEIKMMNRAAKDKYDLTKALETKCRYDRVSEFDQWSAELGGASMVAHAPFLMPTESTECHLKCVGFQNTPGRAVSGSGFSSPESQLKVGNHLLTLTKFSDGKHRLHFMMADGSSKITLNESWKKVKATCICCFMNCDETEMQTANVTVKSERDATVTVVQIKVEGNLFHAHVESKDTTKAVKSWASGGSGFGGGGGGGCSVLGCCCCCCAKCPACSDPCKVCKAAKCCALDQESLYGFFSKTARYQAELEEMLGTVTEDQSSQEPQRFDERIAKDFQGKSKKALLSKNVRSIHLTYQDPATNTIQTALVVVDPSEPLSKAIEFASRLEYLSNAPVGYDPKHAVKYDNPHPKAQTMDRSGGGMMPFGVGVGFGGVGGEGDEGGGSNSISKKIFSCCCCPCKCLCPCCC